MWLGGSMRRTLALYKQGRSREPNVGRLLYGKRKNLVHHTSEAKPSVTTVLAQTPTERLPVALKHALQVNELHREQIATLLKQHRALRRFDRTEVVVQALRDAKQPLTSQHYCVLMAHANDERQTRKALQFWKDAVSEGKVNERLHGALLSTYRNAGNWRAAMRHCESMWRDQQVLDPLATHAVMNACRRYGPWQMGLKVFSDAVQHGTKPNGVVYLELLRLIAQSKMPARWSYGLAILRALEASVEVTAGHYNAVLATMGGRNWEKGIELFHSMQDHNVQPSTETLNTLQQLHPHSVAHCIRCVAEAHALGMPITDTMYRNVLLNLFRMQLNHEATQFAEREYKLDCVDAGNPLTHTLSLSVAMVDALLSHPRPHDALLVYESFQDKIGDVVAAATRQLGTSGSLEQRWLVQGRVAVVDHNVLLSTTFESLIHHYDSVFVPFASVRLLVRRARENGNSVQGLHIKTTLRRLGLLLKREEWRMLRVLPYAHQLLSHTYLSEGGPASPEALKALREEAETQSLLPESPPTPTTVAKAVSAYGQALLRRLTPVGEAAEVAGAVRADQSGERGTEDAAKNLVIREADRGAADIGASSLVSSKALPAAAAAFPMVLHSPRRITSVERVTAVAAMLKSLNPDAEVHVLSTNASQLAAVRHWNAVRVSVLLVPVHYPDQLRQMAPPALPISEGAVAAAVGAPGARGPKSRL
ncbi:hypothetical protein conserved [Leishmania donovani]|uniref:Pentatricopeptide repeat domain family protein n=2 Tax=Leishmania donovani TaxID=5661 RepID=A0A504XTS0_LEIDO|nr:hypothetical protein CGC20_25055 [Leishmania donovani]CAJ1990688.1 hypothetical protein conserved [Leishmania donovani]